MHTRVVHSAPDNGLSQKLGRGQQADLCPIFRLMSLSTPAGRNIPASTSYGRKAAYFLTLSFDNSFTAPGSDTSGFCEVPPNQPFMYNCSYERLIWIDRMMYGASS